MFNPPTFVATNQSDNKRISSIHTNTPSHVS